MIRALDFVHSWAAQNGVDSIESLCHWVDDLNANTHVDICKNKLSDSTTWGYDEADGSIHNQNNSFFQIVGVQKWLDGAVVQEQPMLVQDEIGYLGIICKEMEGVLHLLMQGKIEPGNINHIQISPTIQATKSNFTQQHGGKKPAYLDYFIQASDYEIILDQIQSEQSSRFLGKRNRNMMIRVPEDCQVELQANFRWMTLGQIKSLMKKPNLVNMDTRTVISCIPYAMGSYTAEEKKEMEAYFRDKALYHSIFEPSADNLLPQIYQYINNCKMFSRHTLRRVPLTELSGWTVCDDHIRCKAPHPFFVTFCDIAIEGREVKRWTQPLFEAIGMASFGLFTAIIDGKRLFLVRALEEIGCFDQMELAPTVQLEAGYDLEELQPLDKLFLDKSQGEVGILYDTILSEEGGRFYHEQNHNRIIQIDAEELGILPEGYFWLDYHTLNILNQVNNCLNIQLRNLLSLLEV